MTDGCVAWVWLASQMSQDSTLALDPTHAEHAAADATTTMALMPSAGQVCVYVWWKGGVVGGLTMANCNTGDIHFSLWPNGGVGCR